MVICLKRGVDRLHMVQMIPLHPKTLSSLALFNSRLVTPKPPSVLHFALHFTSSYWVKLKTYINSVLGCPLQISAYG